MRAIARAIQRVPAYLVSISQIEAASHAEIRKCPGDGETTSASRSVEPGSPHERNKERCREDRERPSLGGEKSVRGILEWMRSRHDSHFAIRLQFFDNFVDQTRIDQGFIPLDIDYVREPLCFPRHFGDSISAAAVLRRSQRDVCTPAKRR